MTYQPHFEVCLSHDYYPHNICPSFAIEPTQACQRLLRGHRLVSKPLANGLKVLIPIEENSGQPMLPLESSSIFTFLLKLKSPDFIGFTQLDDSYQPGNSLHIFSSEPSDATNTGAVANRSGELILQKTLFQRQDWNRPLSELSPLEARCKAIAELRNAQQENIFGLIEIRQQDILAQSSGSPQFQIAFTAKRQFWTYYLVTDQTTDEAAFSIKARSGEQALQFVVASAIQSDRIFTSLQQRFPNSQTILLRSEAPIACRKVGNPNLQLIRQGDDKPWISHLPNPPNQHGIQVINMLKTL